MKTRRLGSFAHALPLIAALALAAHLPAQEPEEQRQDVTRDGAIRETLTVRETTLHVRVRTPKRAVEELGQDHFRVFFGERQLPILAFEELRLEAPARRRGGAQEGGVDTTDPDTPGRSILVVLDQLFTPRPYLKDTVHAVRDNLDRLAEGDRIALMTLDTRARLIHHFTRDRRVVEAGLDLLEASFDRDGASAVRHRVETLQNLVEQDPTYDARSAIGLRAALGIATSLNVSFTAPAERGLFSDRAQARFDDGANDLFSVVDASNLNALSGVLRASNESFSDALRLVADVPGPRYSMLFSGGVSGFRDIILLPENNSPLTPAGGAGSSTLGSYQSLSYILQAHGWTVQSFDVSGLGERSQAFSMASSSPRSLNSEDIAAVPELALEGGLADPSNDTLFFLADETGGDFYQQFNSIGPVLRESLDATSHHYRIVVALEASEEELDRRRTLRVEVADLPRKARVTHSLTADWALPPNLRRLDALESARQQLLTGVDEAQLPVDVAQLGVFLASHSETSRRAIVVLDADVGALSRRLRVQEGELRLKVHALASDVEPLPGQTSDFIDLFEVDAAWPNDTTSQTQRILVTGDLIVPCSGAVIRLRFADPSAVDGVLREHLVPDTCGQSASWATPVLENEEDLVFAVERDFSPGDPSQNPFHHEGFTYFPDLRRMVERGDELTVLALGPASRLTLHPDGPGAAAIDAPKIRESGLGDDARLATFKVDALAGLYELGWGSAPPSGALLRVLDFGDGSAQSPSE